MRLSMILLIVPLTTACNAAEAGFRDAETENTIAAYRAYFDLFPEGPFADSAMARITSLAYADAAEAHTEAAYLEFAEGFSGSELAREARAHAADLAFRATRDRNDEDGYMTFVNKYPESEHAQRAKETAAELAYQMVQKVYSENAFSTFLSNHPDSKYTERTERILGDIRAGRYDSKIGCSLRVLGDLSTTKKPGGPQLTSGGPIANLVCEGREIDLESSYILDSFITTKIFGKIRMELRGFSAAFFVRSDQLHRITEWEGR